MYEYFTYDRWRVYSSNSKYVSIAKLQFRQQILTTFHAWRVYSSWHKTPSSLHGEYIRHNAKYCHFFMTSILVSTQNTVIASRRIYSSQYKILSSLHDEYIRHNSKYCHFFMTSILVRDSWPCSCPKLQVAAINRSEGQEESISIENFNQLRISSNGEV